MKKLEGERDEIVVPDEEAISDYYDLRKQLEELNKDLQSVITHPTYSLPFLQPGRLVQVKDGDKDYGWGAVVNYSKRQAPKVSSPSNQADSKGKPAPADETPQEGYIVDVLLVVAIGSTVSRDSRVPSTIRPPPEGETGEPMVIPVLLSTLQGISHIRLHMPKDLRPLPERHTVLKAIKEVKKRFPKGITLLDPIENMGIKDDSFKKLIKVGVFLERRLTAENLNA